ncbi:P-loop containing nucleoside triphosphate hydrolase protein [Lentinula lateritia]|uniref:P-loop containing nucleoside triphosphate hydrolase protein n=1 Tax=Lentinula lateritia TaxID=40482 RepID=A0ABQ8VAX7_9AGAR|nr:P-loop containing nucleoside triphosphate hydrolase protein [Lentinula lateritia]
MTENTVVATIEDDELDIISTSSPPITALTQFSQSISAPVIPVNQVHFPPQSASATRRSLRLKDSSSTILRNTQQKPRKRTISATETSSATHKKAKLEDKKANTAVNNTKKSERDSRRNQWFLRHRDLFEPLLPLSSSFFANLHVAVPGKLPYVPLHEVEQPKSINSSMGCMKDYQIVGLSFLVYMYENGMNCILGDERVIFTLSKTLSLFAYIAERNLGRTDPHLIVCPLSVLSSWEAESARWLPSMTVVRFHGSANERLRLRNTLREGNFDILVTTYEVYVTEDSWFKSRRWTYCVLDEGHKIKNSETIVSQKLQGLNAMYRLILTGTPIQNNMVELWSLLHYLYPAVFTPNTQQLFETSFDLTKGTYSIPFVNAAQKLLSTVMIRRTKVNVDIDVPAREEQTIFIPLTDIQRFWMYRMITRLDSVNFREIFDATMELQDNGAQDGRNEVLSLLEDSSNRAGKETKQWTKLMNLLMQLRRVCDHPYLLPKVEPEPYYIGEHIVASSSKLIVIDKLLADVLPKGEKVLLFSQWTGMLDVLEDMMHLRDIKYARLDGSTLRPRRALDIKLFQHDKSEFQVYLISTKAGGLGINLTKASTVIMVDSDWNPQNDLQAIARAHRIGQKKVVKVYRLICGGSVEDQMLDRIRRKLFLSVKIMGSDNPTSSSSETSDMSSGALLDILRKGSSALLPGAEMELSKFIQAPIAEILSLSKAREDARDAKLEQTLETAKGNPDVHAQQLLKDAEDEEQRLLSGAAQVRCHLFEGQMLERGTSSSNKQIADEWTNLQKRASKSRETVVLNGMTFVVLNSQSMSKPAKVKQEPMGSEDYCNVCQDGGQLICCSFCPRVFHAACRGLKSRDLKKSWHACHQHECWDCSRRTSDAGGMLFRCRTCPRAYCEDCLSEIFDPIGDTLPELLLLNCRESQSAYYISCAHCKAMAEEDPQWKLEWDNTIRAAERALEEDRLLGENF